MNEIPIVNNTASLPIEQAKDSDDALDQACACSNCQTPLSGPFCYRCGQPSKSIIRFFGSLIRELLEDVISLDSRAARTLLALFFKPGFLTNEYIRGRRFRYVPPLRLFLFSSIFCIFILWLVSLVSEQEPLQFDNRPTATEEPAETVITLPDGFEKLSPEEQAKVRQEIQRVNDQLSSFGLTKIKITEDVNSPIDETSITQQKEGLTSDENATSDEKIKQSTKTEDADFNFDFDDDDYNLNLAFLSEEQNQNLANKIAENIKNIKEKPQDFITDLMFMLPKVMLLLVPLFALFIKLSYPFAKRYYVEHLIHAFHGHAFLFLAILVSVLLELVSDQMKLSANGFIVFCGGILAFVEALVLIWIPVYFILSLRNVYRQHWALTLWKWWWLNWVYLFLFLAASTLMVIGSVLLG